MSLYIQDLVPKNSAPNTASRGLQHLTQVALTRECQTQVEKNTQTTVRQARPRVSRGLPRATLTFGTLEDGMLGQKSEGETLT